MNDIQPAVNYIRTTVEPIAHKYTIKLDRDITDPEFFEEELYTIRQARESDILHILINSGGGRLDTAKAFLTSLAQCPAHIITEIEGEACSAATLIFLAGDEYRVSDDATFMIHTSSYGYVGKENNVRQYVEHQAKATDRLLRKYYQYFLTEEEIEKAIEGADFWMDCDEILKRLDNRQKCFEECERKEAADDYSLESIAEQYFSNMKQDCDYLDCSVSDLINQLTLVLEESTEEGRKEDAALPKEIHLFTVYFKECPTQDYHIQKDGKIYDYLAREFFESFSEDPWTSQALKSVADALKVKYAHNISDKKLIQRLDEKVKEIVDSLNS